MITHPNYNSIAAKSPAFTFPQDLLEKTRPTIETGPGSYDIQIRSSSEKFSIGRAPRFKQDHEDERVYFSPNIESRLGYIPPYLLKNQRET